VLLGSIPMTVRSGVVVIRNAGTAFWLRALGWAIAVGLAIAIPTVLIPNRLFGRMTPVRSWDALWIAATALAGMALATRKMPGARSCRMDGTLGGAGLTYLAVGCPICNKIAVALLGVSGALFHFAALQAILGVMGLVLIVLALRTALRAIALQPPATPHPRIDASDGRQSSLA
jgi:hypothetical protein